DHWHKDLVIRWTARGGEDAGEHRVSLENERKTFRYVPPGPVTVVAGFMDLRSGERLHFVREITVAAGEANVADFGEWPTDEAVGGLAGTAPVSDPPLEVKIEGAGVYAVLRAEGGRFRFTR